MNFQLAHKEFNYVEMNSLSDLDKQYKFLAKKRHPDVGGSTESFQKLTMAHDVLKKHIETHHTTNYKRKTNNERFYFSHQEYAKDKKNPSFYNCDPFIQKSSFLIKMIYLFCFIFGIKIKTEFGFTFVVLKRNKIILTKKENHKKAFSIRLPNFNYRASFYNHENKVNIYPNVYVFYI
jgi:hypothetical protein